MNLYRHRALTAADAFIASYPKSGSTWLRFMLIHLLTDREADLDTGGDWIPMVGAQRRAPALLRGSGRLIKTHEPYRQPHGSRYKRAVYLLRDGRDVAVSWYHTQLRRGWYAGTFQDFLALFLAGRVDGYGPWHAHVRSWLGSPLSQRDQLVVVRYEDLLSAPAEHLERVAAFLQIPHDTSAIERAVERNTADRMRERERGTRFHAKQFNPDLLTVRSATAGSWREAFGPDDLRRFTIEAGTLLNELGYAVEA